MSNGFLGVRVGTVPLVEGPVIVSGLRALDSIHGIETFARGPYPLLSSLLGVYAARLGDRSRSTDLFEAGYAEFITPSFSETSEFNRVRFPDRPRVGPLFANLDGFLTSLIYGLPRLHLGAGAPDTWLEGPITMPSAWESIEVDRVWVHGKPMSLQAKHGSERASLTDCRRHRLDVILRAERASCVHWPGASLALLSSSDGT